MELYFLTINESKLMRVLIKLYLLKLKQTEVLS